MANEPIRTIRELYIAVAETPAGGEDLMAIKDPENEGHLLLVCTGLTLAGVSALVEAARQIAASSGRTGRVLRFTAREEFASFGPEPGGDPK
jgi:hypothetical protein